MMKTANNHRSSIRFAFSAYPENDNARSRYAEPLTTALFRAEQGVEAAEKRYKVLFLFNRRPIPYISRPQGPLSGSTGTHIWEYIFGDRKSTRLNSSH